MDPKILAIIGVIVVVGLAAALFIGGGGGSTTNETTSTTTQTNTQSETTTTSTSTSTSSELEGTWQGTYTSSQGSGTWKWVIKKTGENQYVGCLYTQGPYPTQEWIPMQIQVNGNQITLGSIGAVAVTFTGTFEGTSASGTWHSTYDQGSWQGTKISSDNNLPCFIPGESTTTTPAETTTETTTTQETTTSTTTEISCMIPPPENLEWAFNSVNNAILEAFQQVTCLTSGTQNGEYAYSLVVSPFNLNDANQYATTIAQSLRDDGWSDVIVAAQPPAMMVTATYYGDNITIQVGIGITYYSDTQGQVIITISA